MTAKKPFVITEDLRSITRGMPFTVTEKTAMILGEEEILSRKVTLRNLETREQETIPFEQFVEFIK